MNKPKLISTWEELKNIPQESETHILEIEECCGWISAKDERDYDFNKSFIEQIKNQNIYHLSTHTFYGSQYKESTELLQACGFDVEIANWDE